MSGNFLQRGEPALYDKWVRAEAAVRNGVDVVLELPFAFACNSAEYFAKGAVAVLARLGCVSHLVFGSESGSLTKLQATAAVLAGESDLFQASLKKHLGKGMSYPRARYQALLEEDRLGEAAEALRSPNDILAVEYLKQLIRQKSSMEPVTVQRKQTGYKDLVFQGGMASATAIRKVILSDGLDRVREVIPENTYHVLCGNDGKVFASDLLFKTLQYKILTASSKEIAQVFAVGEGLEHKIIKEIKKVRCYEELIRAVVSKRYTQTRIQRVMIHLLLQFTKEEMQWILEHIDQCLYARVLGASSKGRNLLSRIKKEETSSIPVYTNLNRQRDRSGPAERLLRYDILASDLYSLLLQDDLYRQSDFVKKPYIAKQ